MTTPIWVTPAGSFGTVTQNQYSERYLTATDAVSYSLISGSLPPGMSLNTATGRIQGIPVLDNFSSTTRLYAFTFSIRATSSTSSTSDRSFSITVSTQSPFLRGPYNQNRVILSGTSYSVDLGSSGVNTGLGIQWRIAQGRLPPNALLTPEGRVTVNFGSTILPFEHDQFIKPDAPSELPSLSQDFFQYWLQQYFSTAREQDYEFVAELAEPGGIVTQAHYMRIIHTRVPAPFFGSWFTVNNQYIEYDPNQYYYLVLTSLDDKITWNSSYYLGTIENGGISEKSVQATSLSNRTLEYLIKPLYVSQFPQGLKLQSDGLIVGQASFKCHEDDAVNVPIENFYQFVVRAQTQDGTVYSDKTFDLTITRFNQQPYDNLYIRSFPQIRERQGIQAIFSNTNLFPPSFLYRPSDSRFGINRDLKFLFQGGVNPSSLAEYEPALATNHAVRSILLGELRTAVNLDQNLNTVYEVVYIDIIDRWLGRDPVTKLPAGVDNRIDLRPYIKNYYVKNGQSYYELLPNGLENMRDLIDTTIGVANYAAIPSWMRCLQPTNKIGIFRSPLGFFPCIVIAYCQPGKSSVIANNLKQVDFNRFRYEFDRYQLEIGSKYYNTATNSYQAVTKTTFDDETTVFDWNSTRVAENVDYYREPGEGDKYIIFPRSGVFI